ncbi:MAG: RNA polymerase sigma factor [Limnobacter sp.]|nr:RNA polymerase sigma factor [Limnobacter sp.]
METANLKAELATLIEGVANKDRRAFEQLYQLTSRKMFAVALRIVREPGLAQDVLQDAYIRLWRYAHTFNGKLSAPETWLHQVVRNRALDLISQQSNNVTSIPIEEFAETEEVEDYSEATEEASHDGRELKVVMQTCLQKLEGKYRQVLTLAYNHGMSHAEIADHLCVPLGTVKTWARRGLMELKVVYDEHESELEKALRGRAEAYRADSKATGYMA